MAGSLPRLQLSKQPAACRRRAVHRDQRLAGTAQRLRRGGRRRGRGPAELAHRQLRAAGGAALVARPPAAAPVQPPGLLRAGRRRLSGLLTRPPILGASPRRRAMQSCTCMLRRSSGQLPWDIPSWFVWRASAASHGPGQPPSARRTETHRPLRILQSLWSLHRRCTLTNNLDDVWSLPRYSASHI